MKRLVIGILAHVDSGKTTLSEGLLYNAGEISKLGRVDRGDAFLDTNKIERDRGITIFSKQAQLKLENTFISLLDTPGHADLCAEAERTLFVLDYAILVISASDGVQSHTITLWNMLKHYNIPAFIFINKMDLVSDSREKIMQNIREKIGEGCLDFQKTDDSFYETAAMCSDFLMEEYLENGTISKSSVKSAIKMRDVFPCFFGSALKNEGIAEFLKAVDMYTVQEKYKTEFAAKVYKISEDAKGNRLTHLKITGGALRVRALIENGEKISEIRIYSGEKYTCVQEVHAGEVCAVTGLSSSFAGQGLGGENSDSSLLSEPFFTYSVRLPDKTDISEALSIFKKLEQEETRMKVNLSGNPETINIQIMGKIQLEILKRILSDRFNIDVEFEHGSIIYKETIANRVEGVGHYEPLRHYAEVHLLIEPLKRGSGVQICARCSEDVLSKNWQRLILTHLSEKTYLGVLTGSPLTDVKITLINGRAHNKHTEGGDFRQATYRAVRQGLMQAESILLEPWCSFSLEVPTSSVGRAMTDLSTMNAVFDSPETIGDISVICGTAPISAIGEYQMEIIAYTRGKGRLSITFKDYEPCINQDEIIEKIAYDRESDTQNTPDSVFCSHGSGFIVKWNEVFDYMHIPALKVQPEEIKPVSPNKKYDKLIADEAELLQIFEQTYGKIKRKTVNNTVKTQKTPREYKPSVKSVLSGPEYLLVDGYNIIFAWDELKSICNDNPDAARNMLINRLCNYAAMTNIRVILVFDAYRVKGAVREIERINNISVVYTKEAETADTYIEKASSELTKSYRVRVATSDGQVQMIVFGNGAVRASAAEFHKELEEKEREMRKLISEIK